METRLLIGSYGATPAGGFRVYAESGDEGWQLRQHIPVADASFGAWLGRLFVGVSETEAVVHAFTDDGVRLHMVDTVRLAAAGACHVLADARRRAVIVSNFVSGSVSFVPLSPDGRFGPPVTGDLPGGAGPIRGEQDSPHAHCAVATAWGTYLVSDLGADRLLEMSIADGRWSVVRELRTPTGSGPRHLAWVSRQGGWLVVSCEFDASVLLVQASTSALRIVQRHQSAPASLRGASVPSHIEAVGSGRVVVANRGTDTLAVFEFISGGLRPEATFAAGGRCPRHFRADPTAALVALEQADTVAEVSLAGHGVRTILAVPSPAFVSRPPLVPGELDRPEGAS